MYCLQYIGLSFEGVIVLGIDIQNKNYCKMAC